LFDKVLPIHPQPRKDESITSWINHLSSANLLTAQSLLSSYLGRKYWRDRDIDLLVPSEMAVLSHIGRVDGGQEKLNTMALTPWLNLISQGNKMDRKGWISSKSSIRYCPICLSSDGSYSRILWRLHFVALCPVHEVALWNGCWKIGCSSHTARRVRFEERLTTCNICGSRFSEAPVVKPTGCIHLLHFCSSIIDILSRGVPREYEWPYDSSEFFAVFLALVRYLNLYMQRESSWIQILSDHAISTDPPFDWRTNNAVACVLLDESLKLMESWPNNILEFVRHNSARFNRLSVEYGSRYPRSLRVLDLDAANPTRMQQNFSIRRIDQVINLSLRKRVKSAVEYLLHQNATVSLRKVCRIARLSFQSLKSVELREIVEEGKKEFRRKREREIRNAVVTLSTRDIRVTKASVSTYLGRSHRYLRGSRILPTLRDAR
jgi:hypothetical protein